VDSRVPKTIKTQKVFYTGTTIFLLHQSKALDEAFQNGNGILVEAVVEAWGQF
jgi:hypothetical protein